MEEEIIFKIELNRPEAESDLKALTSSMIALREENKLLTESVKNLQKAEGDNTKQIVEATAQIELNKNKVKELNGQQQQLIKTLDAEKGSINQLKAANAALLKERDNISKSTAEGKARIEALNKQYDENSKKINENISETERQKQGYNTLIDILDKINPGTKELVTNVGTVSKGFTQSLGAINQYGFSLKALGSIPILQLFTAITASLGILKSLYERSLPTVEDYREENVKLTKEYLKQKAVLDDLDKSVERQIKLLEAIGGKDIAINRIRQKSVEDRLKFEKEGATFLIVEERRLTKQLKDISDEYDRFGENRNAGEQKTLKEALKLNKEEFEGKKNLINGLINELNILKVQQKQNLEEEGEQIDKFLKEKSDKQKKDAEDALKELEKLEARRRKILSEGVGRDDEDQGDLIIEAYTKVQEAKNEADEERQNVIDGVTDRFLDGLKKRADAEKKSANDRNRLAKSDVETQKERDAQLNSLSSAAISLAKKNSMAGRAIATAATTVDSIEAASAANKGMNKAFPGPVGIALGIVAAIAQIALGISKVAEINNVDLGFKRGGVLSKRKYHSGGMIYGPSHDNGGVKFSVGGKLGFEAEGGEAIINKRSVAMFRPLLSKINQAGGGTKFADGGVPSSFTNQVARQSEAENLSRLMVDRINMIQTVLVYQDFEAKQSQITRGAQRSVIIKS
jgi:DNA repair exonuclease SbcCD ATPase subunit